MALLMIKTSHQNQFKQQIFLQTILEQRTISTLLKKAINAFPVIYSPKWIDDHPWLWLERSFEGALLQNYTQLVNVNVAA